ncbi:hypothetical protein [Ilumatobacter sp.]|uniref:hypothetical protein n=1 Tax=Ilumatobacter sp. TaxID=1967498 RepID=UPI003751EF65
MLAATLAHPLRQVAMVRPSIDEVLEAVEMRHAEWAGPQLIEQIAMRVTGPDPATIAATIEDVCAEAMASAGVVDLAPAAQPGDMLRGSGGAGVARRCRSRFGHVAQARLQTLDQTTRRPRPAR